MSNSKKGFAIIVALFIILCAVLFVGIKKDRELSKKNEEEYIASLANTTKDEAIGNKESNEEIVESNEETSETKTEEKTKEAEDFYGKLKNKESVRVLVLGDGIALSQGHSTENGIWDKQVANFLETTYGSKVELKSLAKSGSTTAIGLETVNGNDISNYDLVFTCFGQNDNNSLVSVNSTKSNYEGIINQIKIHSPNAIIIPIIPNTLSFDNTYRLTIMQVASANSLEVADMKKVFSEANVSEQSLILNTVPNEEGYKLYVKTITDLIKSSAE